MMNITFKPEELLMRDLQEAWNNIEDAFFLTHYELAEASGHDAMSWRTFLSHPAVADWMQGELNLVRESKLRLLMKDLSANSKSTGLPQLINALTNGIDKQEKDSDGPIFIYMHVPLNSQEIHAPNVQITSDDVTQNILKQR